MNNIPRKNDFPPQNDFLFASISATNHFYQTRKITNILNHFSRWIVVFFKKRKFACRHQDETYLVHNTIFMFVCMLIDLYSHITSIFHVVSRNRPETFGFSARHVIDLPSSSVVGTKLRIDFVTLLRASSCDKNGTEGIKN